jgi:hypothetical protein
MIQAFSHIFNFFNIASPCGDMFRSFYKIKKHYIRAILKHIKDKNLK